MTSSANLLVKSNHSFVVKHLNQICFRVGKHQTFLDLKYGIDKNFGLLRFAQLIEIIANHVQKFGNGSWTRIELDIGGKDEVGVGRFPRNVPGHVDGIVERLVLLERRSRPQKLLEVLEITADAEALEIVLGEDLGRFWHLISVEEEVEGYKVPNVLAGV